MARAAVCLTLVASGLLGSEAVKIADMAQGEEFTKCIKITDYQTKTLADDVTIVDRDAGGCCPKDYTAGQKFTSKYQGAQIVCGFKADGTVATSTSSGTCKTCTYNKCYVMKQNIACKASMKQMLNGCCGSTKGSRTFDATKCKHYDSSFNTVNSDKVEYCTTYDKDYGSKKGPEGVTSYQGSTVKTDDQADNKLQPMKVYTYLACPSSLLGSSGGGGDGKNTDSARGISASFCVATMAALFSALL